MKAIEIKNLYFKYDNTSPLILKNVFMDVDYGTITLLSGPSGSGKSTILSIISGIIPHIDRGFVKGDVLIKGKNILNLKMQDIIKDVGVILQNADEQIVGFNTEDEIAFGLENINTPPNIIKEKIDKICATMHLDKTKKCRNLSGGEKERLISSSILSLGQKIILLDEPLANLDKMGCNILLNVLNDLKKEGYAIFIVEHRLDMIIDFVDIIYDVKDGVVSKVFDKNKYLTDVAIKIPDIYKSDVKDTLIKFNNVGYKIKKENKIIFDDVSFEIKIGERVLLLGENGSGKTTLTKLLLGFKKISSGKYYYNSLYKVGSKKWFMDVAVVYQNPNYELFMPTVFEELVFGGHTKDEALEMLELFGIKDLKDRHPQSLSEGQKRKLTVATALIKKPKLLILDEPTVGQDFNSLKNLVEIINKYHEMYNTTIITISHDKRCADAFCDKTLLIKNNKIITGDKSLIDDFFD